MVRRLARQILAPSAAPDRAKYGIASQRYSGTNLLSQNSPDQRIDNVPDVRAGFDELFANERAGRLAVGTDAAGLLRIRA